MFESAVPAEQKSAGRPLDSTMPTCDSSTRGGSWRPANVIAPKE